MTTLISKQTNSCQISFHWQDNPDIQNLLDVIVSIIAQEYIQIAKQNPETFKEIASPFSGIRNDTNNDKNKILHFVQNDKEVK